VTQIDLNEKDAQDMEILCHVRNPICTILASTIWYAYAPCWTVAVNKTEIMHMSSSICKLQV